MLLHPEGRAVRRTITPVIAPAPVHSPEDLTAPGSSLVQQARLGGQPGQKRPVLAGQ